MPLRKLWNTICGTSSKSVAQESSANQNVSETPATTSNAANRIAGKTQTQKSVGRKKLAIAESTRAENEDKPAAVSQAIPHTKAAKKPATKLASLTREDKKLLGRIASLGAASVLEVSVGDGVRALHLVQSLAQAAGQQTDAQSTYLATYLAIDEFELGGNPLTLRSFHQRLREHAVKAQLVPMPIDAGLDRVVRTFGQVDAVIWAADAPPTQAQQNYLTRICKPETVVFSLDQGRWTENRHATATNVRRAA